MMMLVFVVFARLSIVRAFVRWIGRQDGCSERFAIVVGFFVFQTKICFI